LRERPCLSSQEEELVGSLGHAATTAPMFPCSCVNLQSDALAIAGPVRSPGQLRAHWYSGKVTSISSLPVTCRLVDGRAIQLSFSRLGSPLIVCVLNWEASEAWRLDPVPRTRGVGWTSTVSFLRSSLAHLVAQPATTKFVREPSSAACPTRRFRGTSPSLHR
jgi:hypothetical protein